MVTVKEKRKTGGIESLELDVLNGIPTPVFAVDKEFNLIFLNCEAGDGENENLQRSNRSQTRQEEHTDRVFLQRSGG
ncbi:MAG: hypothetical protein KAX38_08865 [Candidatus Krumholzibacteria bacterium]|nr:hypothetical protein [Candidatus Krumholzibacteria bacterium]